MSASREKKTRQDLAAQGITDPKKIREAEEKAKARKSNILYGVIAGVFVLVAAALLVWNSGVLQRNAAALSIDGEKYSASQVNYFYHSIKNNILNGSYKIQRPCLFVTNRPLDAAEEAFVDYIFSDTGRAIVAENGYIPAF